MTAIPAPPNVDPDQWAALQDLAAMRDEPLHPNLVPYQREWEFGVCIKHPLINDMLPINGHVNRAYEQKKAAFLEALAVEDWWTLLQITERPWRCEYLIDFVLGRDGHTGEVLGINHRSDPDLRELVAWVWTDSENINEHVEDWLQITSDWTTGDPLLFGDQAAFDLLPDRIELWRGDCDDGGWSWTTDRKIAEFFSRRMGEFDLLHGWVRKPHVFGYLLNRSESEVMVRREHVEDITVVSRNEE